MSRLFRDTVGTGFPVRRNQLRLPRTTLPLARGRTVTQAADACGSSSSSAPIVAFHAAFGPTPARRTGEFRPDLGRRCRHARAQALLKVSGKRALSLLSAM
nr:hypothetical protein [Nocardiopsis halotolerans]